MNRFTTNLSFILFANEARGWGDVQKRDENAEVAREKNARPVAS